MSAACCPAPSSAPRPRWEVADVFHRYGEAYRRTHALPPSALEGMEAIEACRTPALGGHLERCDECGFERPAYNSCRNRHCPKCQSLAGAQFAPIATPPADRVRAVEAGREALAAIERTMTSGIVTPGPGLRVVKS